VRSSSEYVLFSCCWTDLAFSNHCSGWTSAGVDGSNVYHGLIFRTTIVNSSAGTLSVFSQAMASTSASFSAGEYLAFRLWNRVYPSQSPVGLVLYGDADRANCDTNCVGDPFISLATETIVQDWSVYTTDPANVALLQGGATSTMDYIGERCADSGNVFSRGICTSFAFLFLPDPQTLNSFYGLASTTAEKFPISWFYGVRTAFTSAAASSSANLAAVSISLNSLGMGSTTAIGNILPNVEVFSTSTITHFMPSGLWDVIQALMAAALWIAVATYIWYSTRNLFHV